MTRKISIAVHQSYIEDAIDVLEDMGYSTFVVAAGPWLWLEVVRWENVVGTSGCKNYAVLNEDDEDIIVTVISELRAITL